jgi:hypothetical protein
MAASPRADRTDRSGLYLAITVVALLATLYLVVLIAGLVLKLVFVAAALLLAASAVRAWRGA